MSTLGQRLKAEREKRNLSIEKLAAETRIHARHFQAIEEDRIADLPSGFFYRSFVRQYARILELPEAEYMPVIQRSLDDEAQEMDQRDTALPQRNIDVPPMPTGRFNPKEEAKRWLARLIVLLVVIAGSTGLFYLYQKWRNAPPEQPIITETAPEPQKNAAATPAAAPAGEAAVQQPAASTENPTPAEAQTTLPTPPAAQGQPSSTPSQSAAPAQNAATPQNAPAPEAATQPKALNLTVAASADSWIQVSADGKTLFMDVLRTGQARTFRGNGMIRLKSGNAGGVSMEFNGAAVPPAGPMGQVRTIEFTSAGSRVVPPPVIAPQVTPLAVPRQEQQN